MGDRYPLAVVTECNPRRVLGHVGLEGVNQSASFEVPHADALVAGRRQMDFIRSEHHIANFVFPAFKTTIQLAGRGVPDTDAIAASRPLSRCNQSAVRAEGSAVVL